MNRSSFDTLILIARPAAGKSEIIDYLKRIPLEERLSRFHIGDFFEIDDFPMLWTWFEEDEILERMGHPRLHSDSDGYFLGHHLWNVLIRRINLEHDKAFRNFSDPLTAPTAILEFSRGKEHGGFSTAFSHFKPELLSRSSVLYLDVSWEESLRKNRKRFNPERADSILQHSLADQKLERLYRDSDWAEFSAGNDSYLLVNDIAIPYAVFDNHDDVTTPRGEALGQRLQDTLSILWDRTQKR